MSDLINELMTEVFVEQPLALPGSAKYGYRFSGEDWDYCRG